MAAWTFSSVRACRTIFTLAGRLLAASNWSKRLLTFSWSSFRRAVGGATALLIVRGSNMAGKSTLLRAAGVNAVLALAGAPVRARRLRLAPLAVGATLRIQDSLAAGRSRVQAEVLRVRRLLG